MRPKKSVIQVKCGPRRHDVSEAACAHLEGLALDMGIATKTLASVLALSAFVTAIVAGNFAGNPAPNVLKIAIISMIVCYIVGVIVGMVSEHAITEYIRDHRRANPVRAIAAELDRGSKRPGGTQMGPRDLEGRSP